MDPAEQRQKQGPCRARFRALGDLLVHGKLLSYALRPDGSHDFHPHFAMVAEFLRDADSTIANLETTIGKIGDLPYSGFPRFNTPPSFLDALKDAGVDFLTLANNHILDRGIEGMHSTAHWVRAGGFAFGGIRPVPQEEERPVVVDVNGIRVGFLCYTDVVNIVDESETEAQALERGQRLGVNTLPHARFDADVDKLKAAGADAVIALPHWGLEYRREPEPATVALAKQMVAAGVDVVLGSHSHMVQPVRFVQAQGRDGAVRTGLVAYSLGNFISNQSDRYTDGGIILDLTLRRGAEGEITVGDVALVPTYCWRTDTEVRTLCSARYLKAPPPGMDGETWQRMKETYFELRQLIDERIPFLGAME